MSFRFDRFATLRLVNPIQRCVSTNKSGIPILMYHSVSDTGETGVHPYYRTATTPTVFAMHIRYMYEQGYSTLNLAEAVHLLQTDAPTKKYVVITFDDGYCDFYQNAFPALSQYGFKATVFLPTAYIGASPMKFKGKECLTWAEIRELRKHRIYFGSHTVTHPQLSTLEAQAIKSEVQESKKSIEDNIGECVDSFSYPYAFPEENSTFTKMLRETLIACGYRQGVSTRIGVARPKEERYFLRRLPINSLDDLALFKAKLHGGYDWLHALQYISKSIRPAKA